MLARPISSPRIAALPTVARVAPKRVHSWRRPTYVCVSFCAGVHLSRPPPSRLTYGRTKNLGKGSLGPSQYTAPSNGQTDTEIWCSTWRPIFSTCGVLYPLVDYLFYRYCTALSGGVRTFKSLSIVLLWERAQRGFFSAPAHAMRQGQACQLSFISQRVPPGLRRRMI
ncbi:hypothetical protein BC827DRAFT_221768 [Russula dissimulans]|nr:hypothetical protein BC827DRAFT_221768 [Russula dissimulans]